jgi:hypothetical protein
MAAIKLVLEERRKIREMLEPKEISVEEEDKPKEKKVVSPKRRSKK